MRIVHCTHCYATRSAQIDSACAWCGEADIHEGNGEACSLCLQTRLRRSERTQPRSELSDVFTSGAAAAMVASMMIGIVFVAAWAMVTAGIGVAQAIAP